VVAGALTGEGKPQQVAGAFFAHDDVSLLEQVELGRERAFEELFMRYGARAYRVARSVCRDRSCAEDAVQEAFVSVWRGRASYRPERGPVAAWLLAAVRYRALDVVRREGVHASRRADEAELTAPSSTDRSVGDRAGERVDAVRLRGLLQGLPDAQLEVIVLAFYGELTHAEIAAELELPAGTVKGRMRLGMQKLRADFDAVSV
jgi:RNA polymerase sigma-70 factor (ECF subfamily)